jgi:putative flippase GtrA
MSTISTHLNWGSSYIVNDFYRVQVKPEASEKELVNVGRISTVILMVVSAGIALLLTNAVQLFQYILMFGAGTGLIFILRWFWWRINAWSEISAMLVSGLVSIIFNLSSVSEAMFNEETGMESYLKFPLVVLITTIVWVVVTFITPAEKQEVLESFYKKTQPGGPGWKRIIKKARDRGVDIESGEEESWSVPAGILAMLLGMALIYGCLFFVGYLIYGEYQYALFTGLLALGSGLGLIKVWSKIKAKVL